MKKFDFILCTSVGFIFWQVCYYASFDIFEIRILEGILFGIAVNFVTVDHELLSPIFNTKIKKLFQWIIGFLLAILVTKISTL